MEYSKFSRFHDSLTQFKCYEDYLDSKVTPLDLFYFKVSEKYNFYKHFYPTYHSLHPAILWHCASEPH